MQGSLVLTAMRNEGPFILEWIAWQKMLGFENVLAMFNDCTDHSPQLLRVLEKAGVLNCKRHRPEPGMMRLRHLCCANYVANMCRSVALTLPRN
jgi:hypothetical protein